MNVQRLSSLIETPEFHRQVMGDYTGAYSLGITSDPARPSTLAVRVRVQGDEAPGIASELDVDGETIPVIVSTRFQAPAPLAKRVNVT
jgi:hypothetical protein